MFALYIPRFIALCIYDRIEVEGEYDSLRSTRHFGGLVWYLVQQDRIVGLVKDLVEKYL